MISRIGGLGGLGGYATPSRVGTPDATAVQTDQELLNSFNQWKAGLEAAIPKRNDSILSVANTASNQFSKQYGQYADNPLAPQNTYDTFLDLATRYRTGQGTSGFTGPKEGNTAWVSGLFAERDREDAARTAAINSRIATAEPAFQAQQADRATNVVRQQQAYGNMLGNGQVGGVMGAGFTDPNFGQVTGQAVAQPGQKTGGFNAWGASNPTKAPDPTAGVNMDWTNGAYNGGAGKFTPAPWGGLVPGKWGI